MPRNPLPAAPLGVPVCVGVDVAICAETSPTTAIARTPMATNVAISLVFMCFFTSPYTMCVEGYDSSLKQR